MITTFQDVIKNLMKMKAATRPESSKSDEIESIIQKIISGEKMLSDRIEQAEELINNGVGIMTPEQISQWQGVRAWQETV